jgi:hypothetical protein
MLQFSSGRNFVHSPIRLVLPSIPVNFAVKQNLETAVNERREMVDKTKLLSPQHLKMNPGRKHLTWSDTNTMCSVIMQPPYVSMGLQIHIPLNRLVPM